MSRFHAQLPFCPGVHRAPLHKARRNVQLSSKTFEPGNGKAWLLAIFALALLVRGINLTTIPDQPSWHLEPDSAIYLELRDNFLETGRFLRRDANDGYAPEIERVPGYPLLLAALAGVGLDSPASIVWTQAVIDAGTVVLIALLGATIGPVVGLLAGLLAAFWPNMVVNSTLVLGDTLFLFLITASFLCFARFMRGPAFRVAAFGGLLFGLSLMVRPVFQFLPPILALAAFGSALRNGKGVGVSAGMAAVLIAALALPVAPLIQRNLVQFDTVSLTAQGGTHLLGWVLPLVQWHSQGTPYEEAFQEARVDFDRYLAAEGIDPATLGSFDASRHKQRYVLKALGQVPAADIAEAWVKGAAINLAAPAIASDPRIRSMRTGSLIEDDGGGGWAARLLRQFQTTSPAATAVLVAGLAGSALFSLLQLIGAVSVWSRMPWAVVFGVLLAVYILAVMGPVAGTKYRLPFAMAEIVFAAAGLKFLYDRLGRKNDGASP